MSFMGDYIASWSAWMSSMSVQLFALVGLVLLLDRICSRKSLTTLRWSLWLLVSLKLVLPPSLSSPWAPTVDLASLHAPSSEVEDSSQLPMMSELFLGSTLVEPEKGFASSPLVLKYLANQTVLPSNHSSISKEDLLASKSAVTWREILFRIYCIGAGVFFLIWIVRQAQLFRHLTFVRRYTQQFSVSSRVQRAYVKAQSIVGISKVQLCLRPGAGSPAVVGLFRPKVILPVKSYQTLSDEQLDHVFLHELLHVKNRDLWLQFLGQLLQVVYWFHPVVYLASCC